MARFDNVEVFYAGKQYVEEWNKEMKEWETRYEPGWYYWYCFPGCLPDSDPTGPFPSFVAAKIAATRAKE